VADTATLRDLARIYRKLAGARVRADWQYRGPFIAYTITQGLITVLDFVQIAVIFNRVDALRGWSIAEVAFLYGTSAICFQLCDVFVSEVEFAPKRVRLGTFDSILIRPMGALLQLCADEFAFRRVGKLVQASAVLLYALLALDVHWTPAKLVVLVSMLASGTAIFGAIWVITSSLTFWLIEASEVMNSFTYGSSYAAEYPLSIMTRWLRRALTFVVPAAFVSYFPALFILDKTDPFHAPVWLRFGSPAVAVVSVAIARATWNTAIRHYRSTGS